jgi:histidinol-phosphatase (PHP family)
MRTALVDYHAHTARCGHASGSMEQYVERAIEAGLDELGFSDHLYLYWLPSDARDPELAMADWELDQYVTDVERCRERYRSDITLRLATEADYVPGHERELTSILRRYEWDYVIGSVHFVDGWGLDDSRYMDGYERWDIDTLYARYFDLVAQAGETHLFQTLGHIDLVKKFGHRPRRPLGEAYELLACRMAQAGVCVEVNTAGLRKPCAELYPQADLLAACRNAGVPATFASDAHAPTEVAADVEAAAAALQAAGYAEFVRFEASRRQLTALPTT